MEQRKEAMMAALDAFARQRPGLEFGNYGDVSAYRSESRSITRDLHDYNTLASAVRWRDSITADDLLRAARDAYRLTLKCEQAYKPGEDFRTGRSVPRASVDYCTGQYFPTEYRKAACAVLASALWDYTRANMPKTESDGTVRKAASPGDWLRMHFRKEFGRTIAARWFR